MNPKPLDSEHRRFGRARGLVARLALSSVMRDTSLVALGQTLFKGSVYLASIALARSLDAEQFAAFGYFSVSARFLSIFFAAGLTIAATKAFADAAADGGEREKTAAVIVIMAAAFLAASASSPLYLPLLADDEVRLDGVWLVAGAAAQGSYSVALAAMFGASAFRQLLGPLATGSALLLASAVASAATGSIVPVLIGYVLSFLAPALLFAARLYRRGALSLVRPSAGALREVAFNALPTLAIGTITVGVTWLIARVLLNNAVSTAEFNRFVIGMQWFVLVLFIPNALGNALFPRFLHGAREGRLDVRLAAAAASSILAAILVLALVAALLTPALSDLYGYAFDRPFVFAILAAAALAGPVTMLSYPVIATFGVQRWLGVNLVLLGASVGLLLWRTPQTALDAALVVCGGQGAVLAVALLMLARIPRRQG